MCSRRSVKSLFEGSPLMAGNMGVNLLSRVLITSGINMLA